MATKANWLRCALALSSVGLSACVPTPVRVVCVVEPPPAALMVPPPPVASFQDRLNSILSPYETSPESVTR